MVEQRQSLHRPADGGHARAVRDAEHLVEAELGVAQHQEQRLRRGVLQDDGEQGRPARHGGAAAGPVVYLAGGYTGQPGKGGRLTPARLSRAVNSVCRSALIEGSIEASLSRIRDPERAPRTISVAYVISHPQ
jgi:hypothetical protein